MANDIQKFTKLLISTAKKLRIATNQVEENPAKSFFKIPEILANFETMDKLNQKEGVFESGSAEEQKEFKKALSSFFKQVNKEQSNEKGVGSAILRRNDVVEIADSLMQLNDKWNG